MEKKEDTSTALVSVDDVKVSLVAPEEPSKNHAYCDQSIYQWKVTMNDNSVPFSGLTVLNKELEKAGLKEFISFEEFDEIGGSIVQTNISKVESKNFIEKGSKKLYNK